MTEMFDPFGYTERWFQAMEEIGGRTGEAFATAAAKELYGPTGQVLARKVDETVQTPQDIGTAMQATTMVMMQQSLGWWGSVNPLLNPQVNPWMKACMGTISQPGKSAQPEPGK